MPCTGLGTGHTSLDHKLHAFLFSARLETGSWDEVFRLCSSIVSFTTDWGTEAGLALVPRISVDDSFPWWSAATFFDEDEGGASPPPVPSVPVPDFTYDEDVVEGPCVDYNRCARRNH